MYSLPFGIQNQLNYQQFHEQRFNENAHTILKSSCNLFKYLNLTANIDDRQNNVYTIQHIIQMKIIYGLKLYRK